MLERFGHLDLHDRAHDLAALERFPPDVNNFVSLRAAFEPTGDLPRALDEHPLSRPHERHEVSSADRLADLEKPCQALAFDPFRNVVSELSSRRERPFRVLEPEQAREADFADEVQGLLEIGVRLSGKPTITSVESVRSGRAFASRCTRVTYSARV
jgi:hypothetical protein